MKTIEINQEENIKRFEALLNSVDRPGIDRLMKYIKSSDFYTAPASTKFHLSQKGGLLQHSLNVYDCLMSKKNNPIWENTFSQISDESLIVIALLHDLCKINIYAPTTKNQKSYDPVDIELADPHQIKEDNAGKFIWKTVDAYEVNDPIPLGHGEKSALVALSYVSLKEVEVYAIRWHMGYSEPKENYKYLGDAMTKYPIVLALFEADLEATKLLEE